MPRRFEAENKLSGNSEAEVMQAVANLFSQTARDLIIWTAAAL
jgi:ABC-type uncharacterized transport system auxiliary subunit